MFGTRSPRGARIKVKKRGRLGLGEKKEGQKRGEKKKKEKERRGEERREKIGRRTSAQALASTLARSLQTRDKFVAKGYLWFGSGSLHFLRRWRTGRDIHSIVGRCSDRRPGTGYRSEFGLFGFSSRTSSGRASWTRGWTRRRSGAGWWTRPLGHGESSTRARRRSLILLGGGCGCRWSLRLRNRPSPGGSCSNPNTGA